MAEIQKVILEEMEPSEKIISILAILGATKMTGAVFNKEYRKIAKKKIKEIIESDTIGKHLKSVILAVESSIAVLIGTIIATTAATT